MSGNAEQFPETDWGLIQSAGKPDDDQGRLEALGQIVSRYLPALKRHLISIYRLSPHDADDLLQSFLMKKVVENEFVAFANKDRGRFRNFLLRAVNNFVLNEFRRAGAVKRSPAGELLALEALSASEEPRYSDAADGQFALDFVRLTVDETLRRMQNDCAASQRLEIWKVFEGRILGGVLDEFVVLPYDELVRELGLKSDAEAYKLLHRAKWMFEQIFWSVVAEYSKDPRLVAPEIEELKSVLTLHRSPRPRGSREKI